MTGIVVQRRVRTMHARAAVCDPTATSNMAYHTSKVGYRSQFRTAVAERRGYEIPHHLREGRLMRLVVGGDHAGFSLKGPVVDALRAWGHEVTDVGTNSPEPVD